MVTTSALAVLCGGTAVHGQFVDTSIDHALFASTQATFLGGGMSFADFNSDGLDDLTFTHYEGGLKFFVQGPEGFQETDLGVTFQGEAKGVLWLDYDNDGDQDLLVSNNNGPNKLWCNIDGVLFDCSESSGIEAATDWLSFGLAAADYDLDGYLDVYICNYHDGFCSSEPNILYHNNGDGTFTDVTALAGVGNGVAHSFQAAWFDHDHDGLLDLFVVNDRDEFANALYHNQGDGTFVNIAPNVGADHSIWAMSASVADPDNDGDFEIFCSNIADEPNMLLDKWGEGYVEVAEWSGVNSEKYSWGGAWIDYDGDMFQDLLVATYRFPLTTPYDNYMYHNEGGGMLFFEDVSDDWPNEQTELYCLGYGDVNGDLAPDVVGHGNGNIAQVLENTAVGQADSPNRLTVRLHGTFSNRDAIGSTVRVYAGGEVQLRQVQCGQDFMTQQSSTQFFGLANELAADSIVVNWPSGVQDVWFDVLANQALFLVERSTSAAIVSFGSSCYGEEAWAAFDLEADAVYWNGELAEDGILQLDTSGIYAMEATWLGGLFTILDTLYWERQNPMDLSVDWSPPACAGSPGVLSWLADSANTMLWNGSVMDAIGFSDTTLAGMLNVSLASPLTGCETNFSFALPEPDPLDLLFAYQPALCSDDTAACVATASGGTPDYQINWGLADPQNLGAGSWPVEVSDGHDCMAFDTLTVAIPDPLTLEFTWIHEDEEDGEISVEISGGTSPYELLWNDGATDLVIDSLLAGIYSCVVEDSNGCLSVGAVQLLNVGVQNMPGVDASSLCEGWSVHRTGDRIKLYAPFECLAHSYELRAINGRLLASGPCVLDGCEVLVPGGQSVILSAVDVTGQAVFRSWIPPVQ